MNAPGATRLIAALIRSGFSACVCSPCAGQRCTCGNQPWASMDSQSYLMWCEMGGLDPQKLLQDAQKAGLLPPNSKRQFRAAAPTAVSA